MPAPIILSVSNLGKQYADRWVVQNLNIQVARGDIFGFLGRNGAGKTTTIRMIMDLIQPTTGEIRLFGKTKKELKEDLFKRISATIEYPGFYLNLTARENLQYYAKMRNVPSQKVDEMLEFFGLKKAANQLTREFSLGMKQRLGLARALLHDPELMILDEPTNGLDPAGIHEIRETLKKLNREKEITILFSSHNLAEVEQIASKVGIIHEGKLADEFTLEDFKKQSKHVIEIRVSNPQGAVQLLHSKFATQCEVIDNGLIQIPNGTLQPELINRMLIENGIDVSRITDYTETLEDRFLRLTGGNDNV